MGKLRSSHGKGEGVIRNTTGDKLDLFILQPLGLFCIFAIYKRDEIKRKHGMSSTETSGTDTSATF